jgi:hypothetical protein
VSWATLPISLTVAGEIDGEKLPDEAAVEAVDRGAKAHAETLLAPHFARYYPAFGGERAFLDALAGKAQTEEDELFLAVQRLLGYSAAFKAATLGRNERGDRWSEDANEHARMAKEAARGLASVAPFVLGVGDNSGGIVTGGAVSQTYDPGTF